jgi:RNA polymerase sigma-70 factor (ECF subfamily)
MVSVYGPVVFGTAWRILGRTGDAEGVVQEVFLQAYQLQQEQPVRCWEALLRRLAACRALDRLRTAPNPPAVFEECEPADRLREAIARLPSREATVFCLRCFEGLAYEEIAETLQTTPGAVAGALRKARTRLEAVWSETAPER